MNRILRKYQLALKKAYAIIFFVVLVIIFWIWIFGFFKETKRDEQINMFIVCEYISDSFEETLENNFDDSIKDFNITDISADSYYLEYLFQTKGAIDSDIMILPSSFVSETILVNYFYEVDSKYTNTLDEDEISYGIKIPLEENLGLENYLGFKDEDFYIFVNANSAHLEDSYLLYDVIDFMLEGLNGLEKD